MTFYGVKISPRRIESLFKHLVEWFDAMDCHPNRMSLDIGAKSSPVRSFSRPNSKLAKEGFGSVRGLSLYYLPSGCKIPLWHWIVTTELSGKRLYCIIGIRSSLAALSRKSPLHTIALKAVECLEPSYGIGFRRDMDLGPSLYGGGLAQGLNTWGKEGQEVDKINVWGDAGMNQRVYEEGILRDVYPWNFLTEAQLSGKSDGINLREWISENARHGRLSPFAKQVWLWEVSDSQMSGVRRHLKKAGLLFDPKNYEDDYEDD